MADFTYRANLSAVQIPLLSGEFGRSIIVKQQDQNFIPTVVSKADQDKDIGIPQAYYGHNVMPTSYGYKSIGYSLQIPALGINTFKNIIPLLSSTGEKAYLAINSDGSLYYANQTVGYNWTYLTNTFSKVVVTAGTNTGDGQISNLTTLSGSAVITHIVTMTSATAFNVSSGGSGTVGTLFTTTDGKTSFILSAGASADFVSGDTFTIAITAATFTEDVTVATVAGVDYICVAKTGVFSWDFATNKLKTHILAGIDVNNLLGICVAGGYMICCSSDAVGWSSLIDPLDFIPSLITGAGGGSVEGAKGPIRKIASLATGFVVFTAKNAVSAVSQGNSRYPFLFREISNCGGLTDLTLCTEEAESTGLYAYTTYGLQQVTVSKAVTLLPEITDFLAGQQFEDFDSSTLSFQITRLNSPMQKRLEFVSGRYLVISYGISSLTHAVVFDTAIQRFGKLKIPHVAAFQYGFFDADSADTPKRQLAFLAASGEVKTVDFSVNSNATDSVLLLGKFQYLRTRHLLLCGVDIETVDKDVEFQVYDMPTLDGKNFLSPVAGYLRQPVDGIASYLFSVVGLNHSLLLKGNFRANTIILNFTVAGAR